MIDVITVGSALEDVVFETTQGRIFQTPEDPEAQAHLGFEFGAKIPVENAVFGVGGGAANAAICLSLLGLKPAACVRLGTDRSGKRIRDHFIEHGVDVSLVQYDSARHTGLSALIIKIPEGEHIIFPYRGANSELHISIPQAQKLSPSWIYVSALSGSRAESVLDDVTTIAHATGAHIACNPGSAQIAMPLPALQKFFAAVSVLLVNRDEAIEIVSKAQPVASDVDMGTLLSSLKALGPNMVVITNGAKGAALFDGKQMYQAPAASVKSVDTTGAGDAFGSTFVGSFIHTHGDVSASLQYAIINSASVTKEIGAENGLLTFSEIMNQASAVPVTVSSLS